MTKRTHPGHNLYLTCDPRRAARRRLCPELSPFSRKECQIFFQTPNAVPRMLYKPFQNIRNKIKPFNRIDGLKIPRDKLYIPVLLLEFPPLKFLSSLASASLWRSLSL